jgi:hypothetical protein
MLSKSMDTVERRTVAIRASQAIAGDYGIPDGVPRILKDTNHTIVHLWPSPIVAKVSTKKIFRCRSSSLEKEVNVAGFLLRQVRQSYSVLRAHLRDHIK